MPRFLNATLVLVIIALVVLAATACVPFMGQTSGGTVTQNPRPVKPTPTVVTPTETPSWSVTRNPRPVRPNPTVVGAN